ncbi:MAG TPA: GGDEF domain-containing protein [Planctomycetota bacterium]|nr:GGDEF domain-containing protein [Planctomycetota bacterium]
MTIPHQSDNSIRLSAARDETDNDRLRGIVSPIALSIDLVAALAGDRIATIDEAQTLAHLGKRRGQRFFSDILYAVTHQYFAPEVAAELWPRILQHKIEISRSLNRNVQIVVAALDFLSNFTKDIKLPTLIGESHIFRIVELAMHDGLTGLINHTTCHEILAVELRNYRRHGNLMSVILLDIDDFKLVNDGLGHLEGDRILIEVAAAMKQETRDSDVCSRYGGDEFAVLLPFTTIEMAEQIAERIRLAAMQIHSGERTLSISVGVACCNSDTTTPEALIARADEALYLAKTIGKNRVIMDAEQASRAPSA